MKDAKTLLFEFLAAVTHGQNVAALFAEDGALELPFLHSLGISWRHRGRQAISELQASLPGLYLDFAFKPEDTHVLIDTPEQVFAEYMTHATTAATMRTLHHLFAARLVAENGRIKLVRESLNVVAAPKPSCPAASRTCPIRRKWSSQSPLTTGAETMGQYVDVGWHGGHCGYCDSGRRGDFVTCRIAAQVNVFPIRLPALRERVDDIPLLVEYLVERYAQIAGKKIRSISKKTLVAASANPTVPTIPLVADLAEREKAMIEQALQ
jgi:hypothetical protein